MKRTELVFQQKVVKLKYLAKEESVATYREKGRHFAANFDKFPWSKSWNEKKDRANEPAVKVAF